jgi:hypothetical protein
VSQRMRSMKLVYGGMILILGLLFGGCELSEVVSFLFELGKEVEDDVIVGDEDEMRGDCNEVEEEEWCLNNQAWLYFGQSMH